MPKQLTATVTDQADLALYNIEVAVREETGQAIRRPEAVEIALLVAAKHLPECIAIRAQFIEAHTE